MEALAFLLLVIILIVVIVMKSSVSSRLGNLERKLDEMSRNMATLYKQQTAESREPQRKPVEERPIQRVEVAAKPAIVPEEKKPVETTSMKEVRPDPVPVSKPAVPVIREVIQVPPKKREPNFFERNPDLEKFIGENLANKIGIAILVIGIGFFVKFAIDQNWINEIGRVFIGILCAGILLGVAHRLRKSFVGFSSVLVGGGIAVLYFTIAIAFHQYGIFSQTAAFILMVVITAFAVVLSLGYNRVELAVLAILGGFSSPFMLSTGEGNYVVLFSYMLILNVGMLVLAYYKKWRIVNIICYVFTIVIFGGWLSTRFSGDNVSMIRGAMIFATLFYIVFFVMNIINNVRQRTKFEALEIMMLLSNTFLYYSAGMIMLENEAAKQVQGLFTALLGVFNFTFAYLLYRNQNVDRNLVYMLIGLVLTFVSLAAPIQLEGNYITLFWAAEAVLLLWLSQKSGIRLMAVASVAVTVLMVISLIMDWEQVYFHNTGSHLMMILNKGYITSIVALTSLIITSILLKREKDADKFPARDYMFAISVAVGVFVYFANLLELRHQLSYYVDSYAAQSIVVGTYNMFFILILLLMQKRLQLPAKLKEVFPVWGVVAMVSYFFFYHELVIDSRNEFLNGSGTMTGFFIHYVLVILLVVNVIVSLRMINALENVAEAIYNLHWWLYVFFFVFISSAELDHIVLISFYDPENTYTILEHNHKIGFPILWGITAFALIALGLQQKIKMLRIISLVLLLVTLLKLFIIDLRDISEGGKIAAFISLGVLLLVVSFMYQRLKKLLLEDEPAINDPSEVKE